MLEDEVRIQNFIIFERAMSGDGGLQLHNPAAPELKLNGADPHAYLELLGGQIVGIEFTLWSLDGELAWNFPPEYVEPATDWEPIALPLQLDDVPSGSYNVYAQLGDQTPLVRKVRIKK
jgi:hypothetical protein